MFTVLGAAASGLSGALLSNRQLLSRIGGVAIIAMGLLLRGFVRVPFLLREFRMDSSRIRPGPAGAVPLGMAFAIGWVVGGVQFFAPLTRTAHEHRLAADLNPHRAKAA